MARFVLLIRGGREEENLATATPERMQEMFRLYSTWTDQLRRDGQFLGSEPLGGGKIVRLRDGQPIVDGPYVETKEGVGGYTLIEAADEDAAVAVAKGCPVFFHGGFVEVREIIETR